jgi:hypothetical protein
MTVAQRVEATRIYLAAAALAGATLVFLAFANLHPMYGVPTATVAAVTLLWWWRGVFSRRRVLLWMEERLPELRYALVALAYEPHTPFKSVLEARVRRASARRALAIAGLRLIGLPLLVLLATQLVVRPLAVRFGADNPLASLLTPRPGSPTARDAGRAFNAVVTPPAYSRIATERIDNPTAIGALVGSDLRFSGRWAARATMPKRATVLRLDSDAGQRLVALEPRVDSAPRVELALPPRDTVLAAAVGVIPISATARDDIGIVGGWFEIIVTSGSGESFKSRTAVLGRTAGNNASTMRLESALRIDSLALQPGDIVHLRAVARDANPAEDAEAGSSETRTLRVYRAGESDSVAVEGAPPPEVGKSELSQRMLIMLTEKLVGQLRALSRSAVTTEARSIGQEQGRLRKRVGEIIFTRLTGEEPEEGDTEVAGADTLSPAEALLRAASEATGSGVEETLEEEEGGPVISVNRPLLEAFNEMWEAERRLGVAEPREALPHMRAALAAIQKARAAERLYLRGRPPKIVLDLGRIRLSGKTEGIDPGSRAPRASALNATLARRARFHAALDLLRRDSSAAAVDSLLLLRVDALGDEPRFAAALAAAIDDLRAGRDATAALRAARRAFTGVPDRGSHARWSDAW